MHRDALIATSTEFVCERWSHGEGAIYFYAPVTRDPEGRTWLHPTCARVYQWEVIRARATRIWRVNGSFWNPHGFTLIHDRGGLL